MQINSKNYEAYFLDLIEGRLNSQSIAELETFLSLHPELNKDLEHFEQITIANESFVCPDKESLKKFQFDTAQITKKNFNDFCIAYYEHQLSDEKTKELFDYLATNPDLNEDFYCFEKVYLKPQVEILFFEKKLFYKKEAQKHIMQSIGVRWLSIAAGIAILVTVYLMFIYHKNTQSNAQLTSVVASNQFIRPKSIVNSKSIKPKYLKEENISYYSNLNNNTLKQTNLIDTLSNSELNSFNISTRETSQIAFIQPRELNTIEINSEVTLQNDLNKLINDIDNQTNTQYYSKTNAFERLTKIKMDNLKNKDGKLSFIRLVQVAINGINQFTNSNMKLTQKTDTLGNVIALSFESGAFEYHRVKGK